MTGRTSGSRTSDHALVSTDAPSAKNMEGSGLTPNSKVAGTSYAVPGRLMSRT